MNFSDLTINDVAHWMVDNGYDILSVDGNFIRIGHYSDGILISDIQVI